MNYININGKITTANNAGIPVDNGAFRYGYGLFETMLVQEGEIRLKQYHWERLFAGAKQLYFDIPALMTAQWLEEQVIALVKKNKLEKLCRVRLQLYAAGGGLYGVTTQQPGMIIECFPLDADTLQLNKNGLVTGIAAGVNKSIDSLCNLKSCNALIYAIAARQARANKWNDALIYNTDSNIIESAIANVFWVKDEVVYTPPLSDGCIAGVMRRHIMENIPVTEKSAAVNDLLSADEIFLTNAVKPIRWVGILHEKQYKYDKITSICRLL